MLQNKIWWKRIQFEKKIPSISNLKLSSHCASNKNSKYLNKYESFYEKMHCVHVFQYAIFFVEFLECLENCLDLPSLAINELLHGGSPKVTSSSKSNALGPERFFVTA